MRANQEIETINIDIDQRRKCFLGTREKIREKVEDQKHSTTRLKSM